MIQAIYKGVEIEMESHQLAHGLWRCDYTLITHPDRTRTFHRGDTEYATKDLADEGTLQEARAAIDQITKGKPIQKLDDPPREVDI